MLTTLLKYEFKAVGRILLPLFGAWLIASILLGLSLGGDGNQNTFLITITALIYVFVVIAAIVITTILLIQRFYKNLLGHEGYLMFALPVTTGQHIINKTVSAAVWGTAGTIVAVLSGLLIAGCVEGFGSLFQEFTSLIGDLKPALAEYPSTLFFIPEALILVVLSFAGSAVKIYAAIAVGHQFNNHRILGAIAAYLVFGTAESILSMPLSLIMASEKFYTWLDSTTGFGVFHLGAWALIISGVVYSAIYGIISWKLLDKRLNLE